MTMNEAARIHFAEALTMRLKQAGLSQAELARRLRTEGFGRVGEPRVSEWCRGRALPRDELMILAIESLLSSGPGDLPSGQLAVLYRAAREAPRPEASVPQVPRELPARTAEFTGRKNDLEALTGFLEASADRPTVAVINIDGPGGIGKSALAVEAAWTVTDRFPDGQIYVDLQGSTPGQPPLSPLRALWRVLRSVGVAPSELPEDLQEGSARLRSLTADRRLLLLLDNIRDATQVRHLLLGGSASAIILTSRAKLSFLDGVTALPLTTLDETDAVQLLSRLVGAHRTRAETDAARELVRACGLTPLAIQIAGRRLRARPSWTIDFLLGQLANAQARLNRLRFGDRDLRASLELSYQALVSEQPDAARAFRLVAVLDGPDLPLPIVAALLHQPLEEVEQILEELVDQNLLTSPRPAHYGLHDMLRLLARELLATEAATVRHAAMAAALHTYLVFACDACALLHPASWRLTELRKTIPTGDGTFRDRAHALGWLEAERDNLIAAIEQAAAHPDFTSVAAQLCSALLTFFDMRGHWQDWISVNETILAAARRDGLVAAEAAALADLGTARFRRAEFDESTTLLRDGLALAEQSGLVQVQAACLNGLGAVSMRRGQFDPALSYQNRHLHLTRLAGGPVNQASALTNLGLVHHHLGHIEEAIACYTEGLTILRQQHYRHGQGELLSNLGEAHLQLGRPRQALDCALSSLQVFESLDDRRGQAETQRQIGAIQLQLRQPDHALDYLTRSLALCQELTNGHGEAMTLRDIGTAFQATGHPEQARQHWTQALSLMERLGLPDASQVRELLGATHEPKLMSAAGEEGPIDAPRPNADDLPPAKPGG